MDSLKQNQYFGPVPVSLENYQAQILRQRITIERIDRANMDKAFQSLVMPDRFVARLGPAINSGTAVLIYGPSGNGKTTIGEIIGDIFHTVVYIPYCFEVDGYIFKVFDPTVHEPVASESESGVSTQVQRDPIDRRWVPCHRPFVMTGGELTLEMLDLKFNEIGKFYDAPMHIKALNGTFLIDDFGRQLARPEDILNRWIVPLHSRVDYLTMHTGKSFELPFDELVIFSTNLHPNDLMDPAFQRRIPYKLETVAPPKTCSEGCSRVRPENIAWTSLKPFINRCWKEFAQRGHRWPISSLNSSLSKCLPLVSSKARHQDLHQRISKMPSLTSVSKKLRAGSITWPGPADVFG